jgi:ABC-2 family transporter protein
MKFLALVKDSVREAIDLKVFYVTVVLSAVVSLLVLSLRFRPVPPEEVVEAHNLWYMNWMLKMKHPLMAEINLDAVKHLNIEDFKRLDQGTEPWTGKYQFTMDLELWDAAPAVEDKLQVGGAKAADEANKPVAAKTHKITPQSLQDPLMFAYKWVDTFNVRAVPSTDRKHLRFDVETSGNKSGFRTRPEWYHQPALFFGLVELPIRLLKLEQMVRFIGNDVIGGFGAAVTMLLSCIVTAFFIPNMLAKGTVDLLLVKPINRVTLFLYKFLGGTSFMVLNISVVMLGVWGGFGLSSGYWVNAFLLCIPIFTFQFVIFYAASVLAGVLTRSPIVSILTVVSLWGLFTLVGWAQWYAVEEYKVQNFPSGQFEFEKKTLAEPPRHWAIDVLDFLHAIMPRYKDLDWLTAKEIKTELIKPPDLSRPDLADNYDFQMKLKREFGTYTWGPTLAVSSLFIVIVVGLATWWFATRDY